MVIFIMFFYGIKLRAIFLCKKSFLKENKNSHILACSKGNKRSKSMCSTIFFGMNGWHKKGYPGYYCLLLPKLIGTGWFDIS